MDRLRRRTDRSLYTGYLISLAVHLAAFWLLLLLMMPDGEKDDPVELEITVEPVGAELVMLEVAIAEPELEDESLLADIIGDMSEAAQIQSPFGSMSSGSEGSGRHHATAGSTAGNGGGQGRASFFGTQADGDRFVYIVDVSGSMNRGNGRRIKRAINELLRSIDQLRDDQFFYVLLFSSDTRQMFDEKTPIPQLVNATGENKMRLRTWLATVRANGGTHPQRALSVSLNMSASAVFFLSDGEFNKPKPSGFFDGEALPASEVVARTNLDRIPIHTIAFEDPKSRDNMNNISAATGGEFRYIPEPTGAVTLTSAGRPSGRGGAGAKSYAERRAENWLMIAENAARAGNQDMAQRYYQRIIKGYPHTAAAREAERRQAALDASIAGR